MNLLRLICLLSLCCFLGAARAVPPIPVENPEQIGGRWETATPSGVRGIGFEIVSVSKGPSFVLQNVSLRVYTREGGKEKWGYFNALYRIKPKTDSLPDQTSFEAFDGRHLHIHFTDTTDIEPFDLNIFFVPKANKWIGTWSRNGKDQRVTLTRPEANHDVVPNKFAGDWISAPSPDTVDASTAFNIRESSDGVLSAWLDKGSGYIGEQLDVESISDSAIVLKTNFSSNGQNHFRGSLSADGQLLNGCWGGPNGCEQWAAAEHFRRAPAAASLPSNH